MHYDFRKAKPADSATIWTILQHAIRRRKEDGSNQWQDGYPNLAVVQNDIEKEQGFVLVNGEIIMGYCAILINDEPAYETIEGNWLTTADFVIVHRVAIATDYLGKKLSKVIMNQVENYARHHKIFSIKADTNFDNIAMMKIFDSLGYTYCGEVYFRGSPRKAYEKVLTR